VDIGGELDIATADPAAARVLVALDLDTPRVARRRSACVHPIWM
jgi:hypothetical protein